MPTSITLVATSTSASPAANASIAAAFCFEGSWPWISSTRWSRNSVVRRRSYSAVAALACSASDSSTSGQTTKHWLPGGDLLADALVGARPGTRAVDHVRLDRPAALGQLAQHGGVEVAVGGQRERARDRRGGHVERVRDEARRAPWRRAPRAGARRSGAARRRPPPRASRNSTSARSARACRPRAAAGRSASRPSRSRRRAARRRAREQLERQRAAEQRVERAVVLLGERLGGRHQRGLGAVLDRAQHRARARPPSCRRRPRPSAAAASGARRRGPRRWPPGRRRWSAVSSNGSD